MQLFAKAARAQEARRRRDFMMDTRSAVWAEAKDFKELLREPEGG